MRIEIIYSYMLFVFFKEGGTRLNINFGATLLLESARRDPMIDPPQDLIMPKPLSFQKSLLIFGKV